MKWLTGAALYCMKRCFISKKQTFGGGKIRTFHIFTNAFKLSIRILCMNKFACDTIVVLTE